MSPLTKVFVVLHVVLSLLLTAGLIVFVNRTENFQSQMKANTDALNAAQARANAAEADASAARDAAQQSVNQVNGQIKDVQQQLATAQTQISTENAALAQAASEKALASADFARLTAALTASEDQKSKMSEVLAQTRTDNDALVHKNSDLNIAVSDLTNRLDVANRERAYFAEQLEEAKNANTQYMKKIADLGGNPADLGNPGLRGVPGSAPPINGVVRAVQTINSIPYATISVGAAENVQKGMQFQVIDRNSGQYFGQLTIDSVQTNESTGRLEGPKANDVRPGVEVRTQLE